ncbi:MAG TPA: hypothetical protein VI197_34425 [Polyangiaceae bacterium]
MRSSLFPVVLSLACNGTIDSASVARDPAIAPTPAAADAPREDAGEAAYEEAESAAELALPPAPQLRDADIPWERNPVMRRLGHMEATLSESQYTYGFAVNERNGIYNFDCSGMTYWVLKKAAPRAAAALTYGLEQRPLARDIHRRIASVRPDAPRHGWQRISRVDALEPGDVIAWIKPEVIRSPNTGHVGFVVLPPVPVPRQEHAYLIRFADSTRLLHDDDTREGRNGFGMGTILLLSDPATGAPIAYGWAGLKWRSFETAIALGRPLE